MKFEKLRQAVESCENKLSEKYGFSDRELETARSRGMFRSWNWFNDLEPSVQTAVTEYQDALQKLNYLEKKEVENLKGSKS